MNDNAQLTRVLRATTAAIALGGLQPGWAQLRTLARTAPVWNMGLQTELLRVLGRDELRRLAAECGAADPDALVARVEEIDRGL